MLFMCIEKLRFSMITYFVPVPIEKIGYSEIGNSVHPVLLYHAIQHK